MTRRAFTGLVVTGVILTTFLALRFSFTRWNEGNVLIGTDVELGLTWRVILTDLPLRSEGEWSELYLEVPGLYVGQTMVTAFSQTHNDQPIEGYLTTTRGRSIPLNRKSVCETRCGLYLCLSSPVLENNQEHYEIRQIALRSNRLVSTGRIIWISYNPSSTKDGLPPANSSIYGP